MKTILFAVLFAFVGTLARGQPVEVRTGEHAEFTRVVIYMPSGTDWKFDRSATGYVLRLPTTDGYNLSGFFDKIPKTRIAEIVQRPAQGELEFIVPCRCDARPFLYREGILVIDFADGSARHITPSEPVISAFDNSVGLPNPAAQTVDFMISQNPVIPLSFPISESELKEGSEPLPTDDRSTAAPTAKAVDVVSIFSGEVAEALGAGLTGGFLEPQSMEGKRVAAEAAVDLADQIQVPELPGITARTSLSVGQNKMTNTQSGQICLPDRYFALADWGDERAFHIQIGEARAAVYDDRDQADEAAVTNLAQRFLFFGFGEEALQTLQLQPMQSQERRYLGAIAKLIETRDTPQSDFSGQVSCPSTVSLWALLAQGDGATDAEVERDAVLQTFKALPDAVRDLLAPRLAQAFLRLNDRDASRQVLSRLPRANSFVAEAALAEAAFAASEEGASSALASIAPVVTSSTRASPALLIEFFEVGMESGRRFEEAEFALSNALRFEFSGSADATQLGVVQLRAHLSLGEFNAAQTILTEIAPALLQSEILALETEFVTSAVAEMEDADFGRYAWTDAQLPTSPALRSLISDRLVSMGFPERAQIIASGPADEATMPRSSIENAAFGPPQEREAFSEGEVGEELQRSVEAEKQAVDQPIPAVGKSLREGRELIRGLAARRDELTETLDAISVPATR